jgi:transketolase C-terminal domain/subunit
LAQLDMPIVTVEEHRLSGGLASEVLETANQYRLSIRHLGIGIKRLDHECAGTRHFLLERHGLDCDSIADKTRSWLTHTTHP